MIHTRALARQRYVIQVGVVAALPICGWVHHRRTSFQVAGQYGLDGGSTRRRGDGRGYRLGSPLFHGSSPLAVSLVVGSLVGVVFIGYPLTSAIYPFSLATPPPPAPSSTPAAGSRSSACPTGRRG